jgi:hypothetical protein
MPERDGLMHISYEAANWFSIGIAAVLAAAMGLNHLALLASRRMARTHADSLFEGEENAPVLQFRGASAHFLTFAACKI